MSFFRVTVFDKRKVVQIIAFVDIVQSVFYVTMNSFAIVFTSVSETELKGYPFITLLLIFIMCFYMIHMTLALKLVSALELEETDTLAAAQNAKVWQNWAIVYLIFLVGNCFADVLSAYSWATMVALAGFGVVEILWRLVGIYNVGIYIDELLDKISYDIPTIKFFSVRFPIPVDYEGSIKESNNGVLIT